MLRAKDPFEVYKAKKEIERLEKKAKSRSIRCPSELAPDERGKPEKEAPSRPFFDMSRAWIY